MIYLGNTPVGVGIKGVGEFTKYEQTTAVGVGNNNNYMEIQASFVPKLVLISGGTDESGHILSGAYDFSVNIGGTLYRNSSNQALGRSGYRVEIVDTSPAASATNCLYYDGKILVSRANSNGYFSENDTFTVDIYG